MKVAFNKVKITPNDLVGTPMAGYTREDPCLGKLDDIYAHGTLIEDDFEIKNKKYLLLFSFDLLKLPYSLAIHIKKKLCNKFDSLKSENILLHATHTHSAPDLTGEFHWPGGTLNVIKGIMFGANRNDEYLIWLTNRVVRLTESLFKALKSCKIAWKKEKFNPNIVINRRHPTRDVKPDLGVLSFKNLNNDKIIGLLINYSCHPTTLSYANNKLSADYPGRIVHRIDELSNNEIKSVFFNGAAGDLNPITTCGTNFEALTEEKKEIYGQLGTYEDTIRIGYKIADKAQKLALSIPEEQYHEILEFDSRVKTFLVPLKDVKYFSNAWYRNKLGYALKKLFLIPVARQFKVNFPAFYIEHDFQNTNARTIIQYIDFIAHSKEKTELRNFSIFTVPGELFEEIGLKLLNKSPNRRENSFLFQNSNDWIAYLFPIHEYIEIGGYEPVASFSPLSGNIVEKEMLNLFKEVEKGKKQDFIDF